MSQAPVGHLSMHLDEAGFLQSPGAVPLPSDPPLVESLSSALRGLYSVSGR